MNKTKGAREAERSLIAFDMLAGLSILVSPLLFEAVEPVRTEANPRALIGLGVIAAAFIGIAIYSRIAGDEMDEFVRRTWERACGVAFCATLAAHMLWSQAERALLIRPMSAQDVAAVLIISTGLAWFWLRRSAA